MEILEIRIHQKYEFEILKIFLSGIELYGNSKKRKFPEIVRIGIFQFEYSYDDECLLIYEYLSDNYKNSYINMRLNISKYKIYTLISNINDYLNNCKKIKSSELDI